MTKSTLIFIILFCGVCHKIIAQNTFQLTINTNSDEWSSDYVMLPDGGFIMAYISRSDYNSPFSSHLININKYGEITNEITIVNPEGECKIHNLILAGDGSIVGIGEWTHLGGNSEIWYLAIDTSLSILWEKKYLIEGNLIIRIHSFLDDDNHIKSGAQVSPVQWIYNSGLFFIETTTLGDTVRTKYQYSGNYYPIFDFFKQGDYFKALARVNTNSLSSILTIDTDFNILSVDPVPNQVSNCMTGKPINDSTMYVCGNIIFGPAIDDIGILKINNPSSLLLENHIGMVGDTVDYGGADQSLDFIDRNNIYIAGTSNIDLYSGGYSSAPAWFILSNLDSLLNIRWTKYYFGDAYYVLRGIKIDTDGGVILSGTRYDYQNPDKKQGIQILKVDQDGLFTGIAEKPQAKAHDAIVFPNPGTEYLNLQAGPQINGALFTLFDMQGKLVITRSINNTQLKIASSHLPAGTYPWQIVFKNKVIESGKWVKR